MIDEIYRENGYVKIIDMGGEENYWNIVSREYLNERNVNITIVNAIVLVHCKPECHDQTMQKHMHVCENAGAPDSFQQ